jgi:hypothetical protein
LKIRNKRKLIAIQYYDSGYSNDMKKNDYKLKLIPMQFYCTCLIIFDVSFNGWCSQCSAIQKDSPILKIDSLGHVGRFTSLWSIFVCDVILIYYTIIYIIYIYIYIYTVCIYGSVNVRFSYSHYFFFIQQCANQPLKNVFNVFKNSSFSYVLM